MLGGFFEKNIFNNKWGVKNKTKRNSPEKIEWKGKIIMSNEITKNRNTSIQRDIKNIIRTAIVNDKKVRNYCVYHNVSLGSKKIDAKIKDISFKLEYIKFIIENFDEYSKRYFVEHIVHNKPVKQLEGSSSSIFYNLRKSCESFLQAIEGTEIVEWKDI